MNRSQILAGVALLILSWIVIAAISVLLTREFSDYEPPFGDYDFDACLNERNGSEWCDAYFVALQGVSDFLDETQGIAPAGAVEPSSEKLVLLVVDRYTEGLVVHEVEPLPNGECPPGPSMETVVHLTAGEGPAVVTTSMNENCEIVIDEIR